MRINRTTAPRRVLVTAAQPGPARPGSARPTSHADSTRFAPPSRPRRPSAPGERRVARGMQGAGAVAREPERGQQPLFLAEQLLGHQRPDPDHLVAVVGVGDDVGVLAEDIEYREAVRRERADPAGRLVPVELALALEAL